METTSALSALAALSAEQLSAKLRAMDCNGWLTLEDADLLDRSVLISAILAQQESAL